jgi:hypothetical protein
MLKGIHLTLMMGPVVPVPVPRVVLDSLRGVSVTTSTGSASGFQLTFTLGKNSAINQTMLPAGFFDPQIRVVIIATMNGMPNVLMDGVITQQSVTPGAQPGQSTLTVTGEDLSLVMDLEHERMCFPAMTPDIRVRTILLKYIKYGMIPVVIPVLFPDVSSPTEKIPVQSDTDLAYIKKLAAEAGYIFYIEAGPLPLTNTAYWGPEIRIGIPQKALTVNMDAATNVESLSFTYDGLARTQLTVTIQEPITKIGIEIPVPDIGLLRPPLALKPARTMRKEPLGDTSKLNPVKALLLGLSGSAEASDAVSGSGQLDVLRYGALLKARRLVGVRGAGLTYDGLYFVKSVTHDIKPGEYKQNFTLSRDGLISNIPRVIV